MNRTVIIASIVLLLLGSLAAVVILNIDGDDASTTVAFIMAGIIPTVTALLAYKEAGHAKDEATQAKENTNGILHEALGIPSPDKEHSNDNH